MEAAFEKLSVAASLVRCDCCRCEATRSYLMKCRDWDIDFCRIWPCTKSNPVLETKRPKELVNWTTCTCTNCKLTEDCIRMACEWECVEVVNFSRICLVTGEPQYKALPRFYWRTETPKKYPFRRYCSYCWDREGYISSCRHAGDVWAAENAHRCFMCDMDDWSI